MASFLPYGRQWIDEDDIAAVERALRSDYLTTGPEVDALEAAFAAQVGAEHAVVVNSGTAALHLAYLAAGVGPGDQVIVPSVTFLSTANAALMCGGDVVLCDVDPDTGLITAKTLEKAIAQTKTDPKVITPVHLNGHLVDMDAIGHVADRYGASVVTDCCHALGASYAKNGAPGDGSREAFGCFSLHPVKNIAMGEGGVITTNDPELARTMRRLRSHDMTRDQNDWTNAPQEESPWYYEAHALGYNYRAPDILCALARSQLGKLNRFVERRRKLADLYDEALASFGSVLRPVPRSEGLGGWHLYPVLIDFEATGLTRKDVMQRLRAHGIGTQVHYIPLHQQPLYENRYGRQSLPGAERYYARVLSLPLYPAMVDGDVLRVRNALQNALND